MRGVEVVERYRSYAAQCLAISRNVSDLTGKLVLLEMAQSWLKLAEQACEDAAAQARDFPHPLARD